MSKEDIKAVIAYTLGGLAMILTLYVIIVLEPGYYHADCTDTIMWAGASYDAGKLINPDFSYAALMPMAGNLLMWPLIALFGFGMKAQIIGMLLFFVAFVVAMLGVCRQISMSFRESVLVTGFVLVLLSTSSKLMEIFWGHIIYYSLGAWFTLAVLATGFKFRKEVRRNLKNHGVGKKAIVFGVLLVILTFLSGVNGIQIASISTIPVVGAFLAYLFFEVKRPLQSRKNLNYLIVVCAMIFGIFAGLVSIKPIVGNVVADYANAYSLFGDMGDWMTNLLNIPENLFTLLGVRLEEGTRLFSITGIKMIIRIATTLVLFGIPVVMLCRYRKLKKPEYKIVLWTHWMTAAVILFGWIFGRLNAANWRLSPLIVTAALCCAIQIKELAGKQRLVRFAWLLAVPLACISLMTAMQCIVLPTESDTNQQIKQVIKTLEEKQISYGYASFWQANIITLMSDAKVQASCVEFTGAGISPNYYQTNRNWYGKDGHGGKCFVLMTQEEFAEMVFAEEATYTEEKDCGDFKILIYETNIFDGVSENAIY